MTFKEFQDYYANKFQRNNPLPWQDGMQAIIWWVTQSVPKNTRVTLAYGNESKVEISGDGTDASPYIWAFTLDMQGFAGPQGPAGPQGGLRQHRINLSKLHTENHLIDRFNITLYSEKTTSLTFDEILHLLIYPTPVCYVEETPTDNNTYGVLTIQSNESIGSMKAYGLIGNGSTTSKYVSITIDNTFDIIDNL